MIDDLKKKFGPKCSAINVNGCYSSIQIPFNKMKFCEAVNYSFNTPVRINNSNLGCPGARWKMGFDKNSEKLAKFISKNTHIPVSFITEAFNQITTLNKDINQINLGITNEMEEITPPDLYIIYIQPARITEILHLFARHNMQASIPPYCLLSVCGNVFVNSYTNQHVSISFGCPESRRYGGINKNEVVLGVPGSLIKYLLN